MNLAAGSSLGQTRRLFQTPQKQLYETFLVHFLEFIRIRAATAEYLRTTLYQILKILGVKLFEKVPILRALDASSSKDDLLEDSNELILFNFGWGKRCILRKMT